MNVTVAICAYNARDRIGMVLDSLASQEVSGGLRWEIVVVDNASTDGTGEWVERRCVELGLPVRVIREEEAGLANARRAVAEAAEGELMCFLDDDVVAPPTWIDTCWRWAEAHPRCGVFGGRVVPLFEDVSARPADFDFWYRGVLSMQDLGPEPVRLGVYEGPRIVGAGMAGRREVFRAAFGDLRSIAVGRTGTSLAGGEDFEAQIVAVRLGWEVWYTPELVLQHFVPTRKLNWDYLNRWFVDTAKCHAWLAILSEFDRAPTRWELLRRWLCEWPGLLRLVPSSLLGKRAAPGADRSLWLRQQWARMKGMWGLVVGADRVRGFFERLEQIKAEGKRDGGVVVGKECGGK